MLLEAIMDPNPESQQQQRQVSHHQQQPQPGTSAADADDEDVPEPALEPVGSGSVLFDRVHRMMEKFATTRIGQYVLERGDRVLRTIEDTVKWSLPQDKAAGPLVRPLPWIPFLVLIIFLRQVRIWLSLVALFIGNGPVTPHTLIYFIQTRRRKLRSIRINGMKAIQQEAADRKALKPEYDNKFLVNLCKIFTIARCRPRLGCQPAGIVFSADNPANRELLRPLQPARYKFKREREDDDPIKEFVTARLMAKFPDVTSDDDSDYVPKAPDSNDDSTLSANNTTSDTQGEYSLDTSGENVDEQSLEECEEMDKNKSLNKSERTDGENTLNDENKKAAEVRKESEIPEKKISAELNAETKEEKTIPTIEISGSEEKNDSPRKPKDQKDKQQEIVSPSSDKTITASPKTPTSPVDNGQSKSGISDDVSEAEALSVKSQTPKSQKEHIFNILNGHKDEQKKATPGHESAADTKPHIPPALLSSTTSSSSGSGSGSGSGSVLVNASSPDFSTFHKPPNNQQKPTVSVETAKASSVHVDAEDDDNDDDDDEHSQHAKQQRSQPEQQRAGHYPQQTHPHSFRRYRRNRR
uniref:Uncharacterized protein n=1 Tax=Ceratitis capitata TaxID=7213 RepID=W8BFC3_CERCA